MVSIPIKVEIELSESSKEALREIVKDSVNIVSEFKVRRDAATYTRAEVLREEWKPKYHLGMLGYDILGESCFRIGSDNRINYITSGCALGIKDWVFAPTRELAREIVAIREGKWLPKVGDFACGYNSKNGKCSSWICADMEHDWTEEGRELNCHYFPSPAQRTRYIEKQKAEEAVTKCNQLPAPESIEVQIGNQFFEYKYHSAKGGYVSEPKPCKTCGGTGIVFGILSSHDTPCPNCKREEFVDIEKGHTVKFIDGTKWVATKVIPSGDVAVVEYRRVP